MKALAAKQESHAAPGKVNARAATPEPEPFGLFELTEETPFIQRKASCACGGGCPRCKPGSLPVSQPADQLEREADSHADQVLRKHESHFVEQTHNQTPREVTSLFSSYFNTDFSGVRLHTDDQAATSAKTLSARAFTVGSDIAFARNEFAPQTSAGRQLLAHEFAHVVQQRNSPPQIQRQDDGTGLRRVQIWGGIPDFLDCTRADLDNDSDTSCCSSTTRGLIPALYATSREYTDRAITRMESNANMDGALQRHFGAGALSQRATILANLRTIRAELGNESRHIVRCRIAQSMENDLEVMLRGAADARLFCQFDVLATGRVGGNVATLCVNAEGRPAGGWSTLLHEMVHLSGIGNLPDRNRATPAQTSAGEFETYEGETTYPNPNNFALRNADSYSSLVEEVGASSWTAESNPAAFLPTLDVGGVLTLQSQPRPGLIAGMQWTPFGSSLQGIIGARAIWLPHRDEEAGEGVRPTDLRAYAGPELGLRWIGGQGGVRFILDVAGGAGPYVTVNGDVDAALSARLGVGARFGGPGAGFGVSADVMRLFHFDSGGLVGTSTDDWLGGLVISGHWGGTSTRPR